MFKECVDSYVSIWKNFADFKGRTCRRTYWQFVLVNFIISFLIGFLAGFWGAFSSTLEGVFTGLSSLYSIAVFIPSSAIAVRRMHDIGRRWYYLLIPIYDIYLLCRAGDPFTNQYGQPTGNTLAISGRSQPSMTYSQSSQPPRVQIRYCSNCGNRLAGTEAFCSRCGRPTQIKQ